MFVNYILKHLYKFEKDTQLTKNPDFLDKNIILKINVNKGKCSENRVKVTVKL